MKYAIPLLLLLLLTACVETTDGLDVENPPGSTANPGLDEPLPGGSGQVTLTWLSPSENVDGTTLTDLAGFRIYYQTERGTRQSIVDLSASELGTGLAQYTHTISALPAPDTYEFSISAFDLDGNESALSGSVSAFIDAI